MQVLFVVALMTLFVLAAMSTEVFLTERNISNLLKQMVTTGLLSFGMLCVILTGGIDLSVGAIVAFSGIICAGLSSGLPLWLAFLIGWACGVGIGAINGTLVSRFGLAPFVVTLAALTTVRGFTYVYSEVPIGPTDKSFFVLGSKMFGPIPLATIIMIVVFVLGWVMLNRTPAGRALIAIGGNAETVRLAGINVRKHVTMAYVISGACASLAGVILVSRVGIAQPSVGTAYELDAIAACVIGGASLAGGKGTVRGTVGGVVVLALINNLLNLWGVQSFWQQVFKGLIIIAVILLQRRGKTG